MEPNITIRLLTSDDADLLSAVGDDVFDGPAIPARASAFLDDPRHHMAGAFDQGALIGVASAVHYEHPDKPTEPWINEVGVAETHHRRGIGRALMEALFHHGRTLGCAEAWVLTEHDNAAARVLYQSSGGTESDALMISFDLTDQQNT